MPGAVDFYFDFVSPYGYLAATQIDALAARYRRPVVWRPFLLGVTVEKIMGLKPLMSTPLKSDYCAMDLPRMAEVLGVPIVFPTRPVNPLPAGRIYCWATELDAGKAQDLARALFARQWVAGDSIDEPEIVCDEAARAGFDRNAAAAALADDRVKARLKEATDTAVAAKVFGSPTFIVDGQMIWGVDRLWMVERWLEHGRWAAA